MSFVGQPACGHGVVFRMLMVHGVRFQMLFWNRACQLAARAKRRLRLKPGSRGARDEMPANESESNGGQISIDALNVMLPRGFHNVKTVGHIVKVWRACGRGMRRKP